MEIKELETELKSLNDKFESASQRNSELQDKVATLETEKAQWIASSQTTANQGGSRMSVEKSILSSFGAKSIKDLARVNTNHPRFAAVPAEMKAHVIQLKQDIDTSRAMAQMFHGDRQDGDLENEAGISRCTEVLNTKFAKEVDLAGRVKAFGTGVAGEGLEFVPTLLSDQYMEEIELQKQIPGLFREFPMPSATYKMPMTLNYTVGRKVAEDTELTNTTFNTTDVTYDSEKIFEYFRLPTELEEDSAPAILQIARAQVVESIIRAYETAILNGDTTGTHMDSDVTAASDARKLWMGLRKKALANSANGSVINVNSAFTYQKLLEMRAAMGPAGINPKDLVLIPSTLIHTQMLGLDEIVTVDKAGPAATLLSGSLSSLGGIAILPSAFMRDDLNASGVYDGVTVDNSAVILVNIKRFMMGLRRPIRVKAQRDPRAEFDRWQLVAMSRMAFNGAPQSAKEVSVVLGANITV